MGYLFDSKFIRDNCSILITIILTPLLLFAAIPILPTFDDWTAYTSPSFEPLLRKETFLFYGYHWRPFDKIIGYIAGLNPTLLYPALNHCIIVVGHAFCTITLFYILHILNLRRLTVNICTLFFFLSPATMATVLAVDSMNQVYSLLFAMIAFIVYLKMKSAAKYILFTVILFISALWKENGIMWALVSPILAYAFQRIDFKQLKKDTVIGIGIGLLYALAIVIQPKEMEIYHEYVPTIRTVIVSFFKFIFISFITIDYLYLLCDAKRNLLLAVLTFIPTIPFLYTIYIKKRHLLTSRKDICIISCMLLAAAPHILTVFSMMHTYGVLIFVILIIAVAIDDYTDNCKHILISSVLLTASSLVIDIHLCYESYKTSLLCREMSMKAIEKTGSAAENVFLVIIEDDDKKLSSFHVIPYEAFGWGRAVEYFTGYKWPKEVTDTTIERSSSAMTVAEQIARKKICSEGYDCVWIVNKSDLKAIRK